MYCNAFNVCMKFSEAKRYVMCVCGVKHCKDCDGVGESLLLGNVAETSVCASKSEAKWRRETKSFDDDLGVIIASVAEYEERMDSKSSSSSRIVDGSLREDEAIEAPSVLLDNNDDVDAEDDSDDEEDDASVAKFEAFGD